MSSCLFRFSLHSFYKTNSKNFTGGFRFAFSASLSGKLILDGGTNITEIGFYLSEQKDSITNGIKIMAGEGIVTFSYKLIQTSANAVRQKVASNMD